MEISTATTKTVTTGVFGRDVGGTLVAMYAVAQFDAMGQLVLRLHSWGPPLESDNHAWGLFEQYLRFDRVTGNLQYLESIDDPSLTLCDEIIFLEDAALDLDLSDDLVVALRTALRMSSSVLGFCLLTPEELSEQPFSDTAEFRSMIDRLGAGTHEELGI